MADKPSVMDLWHTARRAHPDDPDAARVHYVEAMVVNGYLIPNSMKCPDCRGDGSVLIGERGEFPEQVCDTCGGSGTLKLVEP